MCGCVFWRERDNYQWSFHLHKSKNSMREKKPIRNSWVVLYFVEALGKESVNWPLPVLAPPSQCIVAACLRHGSHCQRLTTTSLLFPCSGQRATHSHPRYSTKQQRGEQLSRRRQDSRVCLHRAAGEPVRRKTYSNSVLCACSCLALRTSTKLRSSITSAA